MYTSLKQALYQLEQLCDSHRQINEYIHTEDLVKAYKEKRIEHTTVITVVSSANFEPNFINVTLQLFCLDKTLKGDQNFKDVENNTLAIIGDLINYINQDDQWRYARIINNPTATKLIERDLDVCSGWSATISLRLVKDNGNCNVPINAITPLGN